MPVLHGCIIADPSLAYTGGMSINSQPKHIHIRIGEDLHRRVVEATRRRGYGSMNTWILDALATAGYGTALGVIYAANLG